MSIIELLVVCGSNFHSFITDLSDWSKRMQEIFNQRAKFFQNDPSIWKPHLECISAAISKPRYESEWMGVVGGVGGGGMGGPFMIMILGSGQKECEKSSISFSRMTHRYGNPISSVQTSNLKSFHPEILKKSNHILRICKNADIGNQMYGILDLTTPRLSFYEFGKFLFFAHNNCGVNDSKVEVQWKNHSAWFEMVPLNE